MATSINSVVYYGNAGLDYSAYQCQPGELLLDGSWYRHRFTNVGRGYRLLCVDCILPTYEDSSLSTPMVSTGHLHNLIATAIDRIVPTLKALNVHVLLTPDTITSEGRQLLTAAGIFVVSIIMIMLYEYDCLYMFSLL